MRSVGEFGAEYSKDGFVPRWVPTSLLSEPVQCAVVNSNTLVSAFGDVRRSGRRTLRTACCLSKST